MKKLDILIPDYYGLRYQDNTPNRNWKWLKLRHKVMSQIDESVKLLFCIRFIDPIPQKIEDEFARNYLLLQNLFILLTYYRNNIPQPLSEKIFPLLFQLNFGDYNNDHYGFYKNQLSIGNIERKLQEYSKCVGQIPQQTELMILIHFSQHPFYNITFYQASFRGVEKMIGLNCHGFYMFDEEKNSQYHIPWIYFEEMVASRDFCVLRLVNFPPVMFRDLLHDELDSILDGSFTGGKNSKFVRELRLKFASHSLLMNFFEDFTQNHYFYMDTGTKDDKTKPKDCVAKNLTFLRQRHLKPHTSNLSKRYSIKSLNILLNSPLNECVDIKDFEDFSLIFGQVPFKIKNKGNTNKILTSSAINREVQPNFSSNIKFSDNTDTDVKISKCIPEILSDINYSQPSSEREFNDMLISRSQLDIEESISIDKNINKVIDQCERYFESPELTNDINKENFQEGSDPLPMEFHRFLRSNEALIEALSSQLDQNMASFKSLPSVEVESTDNYSQDTDQEV